MVPFSEQEVDESLLSVSWSDQESFRRIFIEEAQQVATFSASEARGSVLEYFFLSPFYLGTGQDSLNEKLRLGELEAGEGGEDLSQKVGTVFEICWANEPGLRYLTGDSECILSSWCVFGLRRVSQKGPMDGDVRARVTEEMYCIQGPLVSQSPRAGVLFRSLLHRGMSSLCSSLKTLEDAAQKGREGADSPTLSTN